MRYIKEIIKMIYYHFEIVLVGLLKRTYKRIKPYLHWKMLLVFGGVWVLTTGIWYIIAFAPLGLPSWLVWFARGYMAILWLPTTPEKLITIPISIWIYKFIFKEEIDRRNLDVNREVKRDEINNSRYK